VNRRLLRYGALIAGTLLLLAWGVAAVARTDATAARVPGGDWRQFGDGAQGSGVGPADTGITAGNARSLQVRTVHLDGTVDSAAVELHAIRVKGRPRDLAIVTTTYGRTIALDAGTGATLWEYSPSDLGGYAGSSQVTTATPIVDPDRRYVYAASPDGLIHKLAAATGHEVRAGHWPARVTFLPAREKLASALNIDGGSVVVVTGGYIGDAQPYQGHVAMIDRSSGQVTRVFNSLCSDRHQLITDPGSCPASDSAIWGRAGAVVEPRGGRMLIATGNAPFNGSTYWGDSVLELGAKARLLHNWTPTDQAALNANDTDLGSTSPALLPFGLAVQGGKDGFLHLLNLKRLNGTAGGAGRRLGGELQDIASPGSGQVLTQPAVWQRGGRTYVFVADDNGTSAYLLSSGRVHRLREVWARHTAGTSPVVAGGLLYVFDHRAGVLRVMAPRSGASIATLPASSGHWNSPIVVGGRVILPVGSYHDHAASGTLEIYHLPGR
jgi:outer membrane protein assembly factor BamB